MYKRPLTSHSQRKWKKNGADKYDFLREPWSWVSNNHGSFSWTWLLFRSPAECPANRNIIFRLYRFSFHKPIRSRLVRGRLYLPFKPWESTAESAALRPLNSGYNTDWMWRSGWVERSMQLPSISWMIGFDKRLRFSITILATLPSLRRTRLFW